MNIDPPIDDPTALRGSQRVFKTQLVICLWVGISSFILFCILRYRWPHIYAVRTLRKRTEAIKPLPNKIFGWVVNVYRITDEEVLQFSGLDAFVFLAFFKMGIRIFSLLAVLAIFVLSPIRYYYTGNYDKDNIVWSVARSFITFNYDNPTPPDLNDDFPNYLWVYPIFTYIFSIIVYVTIYEYTDKVLKTRQKYLASQNSIVDRTIRLDGIPKKLLRNNNPSTLKNFIEDLGIGKVTDVKLIYDWTDLEVLFEKRKVLLDKLENLYASVYGLAIDIYTQKKTPSVLPKNAIDSVIDSPKGISMKEKIDKFSSTIINLDKEIKAIQGKFDPITSTIELQNSSFKQISSAFITMDSVASAQMAAQTVLDPRVHKLIVKLAPAPKDIKWKNFRLTRYEKLLKSYLITFIVMLSCVILLFPVSSLAALINVKTITKLWPALGKFIGKSKWLTTFVTGILPPLLFSLLNILLPYFYRFLSQYQGYSSNSDIELSTLLKNFFYLFVNLFLVFTFAGTFSNYWSFLSDTTKIAYQLASSLKSLSLFYVDLILLQGLAMFPVRLLQIGDVVILNVIGKIFLLKNIILKTPRDYRFYYYTPPMFDFGLQVPQHILIFIIILIYSVVSTKIVTSGLIYFILGYLVYKYQLIYTCVHPPHSTGKVWTMIFRRLMLGLVLFQLFMCGTLALEGAILLALLSSPLVFVTLVITWNFEMHYLPLNKFIALRAIQNPYDFDKEFDDDRLEISDSNNQNQTEEAGEADETSLLIQGRHSVNNFHELRRRRSTIDEEREQYTDYTYPHLIDPLYGPWVGFEGDYISMVEYNKNFIDVDNLENGDISIISTTEREIVLKKKLRVSEWE